jgi:hypothetical protein
MEAVPISRPSALAASWIFPGCPDFLLAIARALQPQLHVRLSAAELDLADQHVPELHGLRTNNAQRVRPRGRRRSELYLPASIRACNAGHGLIREFHSDFLSRLGLRIYDVRRIFGLAFRRI